MDAEAYYATKTHKLLTKMTAWKRLRFKRFREKTRLENTLSLSLYWYSAQHMLMPKNTRIGIIHEMDEMIWAKDPSISPPQSPNSEQINYLTHRNKKGDTGSQSKP